MLLKLFSIVLILSGFTACKQTGLDNFESEILVDSIYVYEDADKKVAFPSVQNLPIGKKFIQQQQLDKVAIKANVTSWIKLIPSKEIVSEKNYILELNRPTLDTLTAFIITNDGSWRTIVTGDTKPFHSRNIPHENFLFKISGQVLNSVEFPVYIKIQNHAITSSSLKLWEVNEFYKADQKKTLLKGFYFGALLALVIFNFLIYLSVRDISYLWYVAYLGFILLFLLAYSGITFRYFWPNSPEWANYSTYFSLVIAMSTGLSFTRNMLNVKAFHPTLASTLKWAGIGLSLIAVLGFFLGNAFLSALIPYLALGVILLIVVSIILSIRKGYKPAYYVGLAFLFLFIGSMMMILFKLEILPATIFSEYVFHVGILLEAFLLSFALAYRIKYINEQLKQSKQKMIDSKRQFAKRLIEYQDQQRKETSETLHDSIGQKLLVIKIQLAQVLKIFNVSDDHSKVKSVTGLINEVINDVRDVSHFLHPHQIERLTLTEALEDIILQSFNDTQINHHFDFNDLEKCIDTNSKLHIYRIIQESISNILRHAAANNVEFSSGIANNKLEIVIKDDGKGAFNKKWYKNGDYKKAYGIANIKERVNSLNGTVSFLSGKGMGLQIKIVVPCQNIRTIRCVIR